MRLLYQLKLRSDNNRSPNCSVSSTLNEYCQLVINGISCSARWLSKIIAAPGHKTDFKCSIWKFGTRHPSERNYRFFIDRLLFLFGGPSHPTLHYSHFINFACVHHSVLWKCASRSLTLIKWTRSKKKTKDTAASPNRMHSSIK